MKVIVITLTKFGIVYQEVFTKSKVACETMISWLKEIAEEYDMSLKEFTEIEDNIRLNCYYGNEEKINFDLGKYNIDYREFNIK